MGEGKRLRRQLRDLGIRQEGDPILRAVAQPFDLPRESHAAAALLDDLRHRMARVAEIYPFRKGMGLAAPQIGLSHAAAIVKPPNGSEVITLLNPTVVDRSADEDDRYEGCLSFFDVRGMTRRPLRIVVEISGLDGSRRAESFDQGIARLVLHEIDHLLGKLYADELVPGSKLVPLDEYRETRASWHY
jgi:peptide deformylase